MRAVVLSDHLGPSSLQIREVPDPDPGPDEVLVDVHATALNRADLLQCLGLYPDPFPGPFEIPGLEFSGVVTATGARVTGVDVGDHVMSIHSGGGYADKIALHHRQVMPVPAVVGVADAAAIPEAFVTAWDALVVQGGLTSGRWALVHAGASGVGTAAIQIVKAIGGRVAVTCSGSKVDACRALGADLVIDYDREDFVAVVAQATSGRGVDVVLDVIGGDYVNRNLRAVAHQGTIAQVGLMGGGTTEVNTGLLLSKRVRWVGTVLRPRPVEQKIAVIQRFAREVLPLFDSGALRPVIDVRFGIDQIQAAHGRMAANANVGKILVDLR